MHIKYEDTWLWVSSQERHKTRNVLFTGRVKSSNMKEVKQTKTKCPSSIKSHKNDTLKKCMCCGKTTHPCNKFRAWDASTIWRGLQSAWETHYINFYSTIYWAGWNFRTDSDKNFLGTVESQQETQWITLFKVNDAEIKFKIDTLVLKFQGVMKLLLKSSRFSINTMAPLTILRQLTANLIFKLVTYKQTVFVVKDPKILGCLQSHVLTSFQESTRFTAGWWS